MGFGDGRQLIGSNIGSDWLPLAALQKMSKRVWIGFVTRSAVAIGEVRGGAERREGTWTGPGQEEPPPDRQTSVGLFRMR